MKRIAIAPHMKCNAACAHCCVSAHPKDERSLDDNDVERLVAEAIQDPSIEMVTFTGGEALLRWDFMVGLMRRLHGAGKCSTIVSNGFWAVTPEIAAKRLQELADAGLKLLTISVDSFHVPFVPTERVRNVLEARHQVPELMVHLNMCESRTHKADDCLAILGSALEGVEISRVDIAPSGNAASLPQDEFVMECLSTDPNLRCPGSMLVFASDDQVYPCCSTGIMNSHLAVGHVSELSLDEAAYRVEHNLLFSIMQKEGIGWLVQVMKDAGVPRFQEPFPVVGACHLCAEVFADEEELQALIPALRAYRESFVEKRRWLCDESQL